MYIGQVTVTNVRAVLLTMGNVHREVTVTNVRAVLLTMGNVDRGGNSN